MWHQPNYFPNIVEEQDEDLTLAIQMSMQSADVQRQMMQERAESRRQRAHSHSESLNDSMSGGLNEPPTADNSSTTNIEQGISCKKGVWMDTICRFIAPTGIYCLITLKVALVSRL